MTRTPEFKATLILGAFFLVEAAWVALNLLANPWGFLRYLGFAPGLLGTPFGWLLALIVTAIFVAYSLRLPSVRANLFRPSWLKLLALAMALAAGVLEEAIFRRMFMDYLHSHGFGVALQVLASGLVFGMAHGIWGLFGRSWRAAFGATLVTGVLGVALAVVYVVSDRSVTSCVVAHFIIDACIEPGVVMAAVRGEMNRPRGGNRGLA